MDVFIEISEDNALKMTKVLNEFGFKSPALKTEDFLSPETIIQLGRAPVRIDILTSITGVTWGEVWKNRKKGVFGESKIPTHFIGKEQLIKNKTATRRDQDIVDVKKLMKAGFHST